MDIYLNREACYRALLTRDARFDGRFYTAVVSTGIFCRPICPARPPKIENCVFLPSAAAAHQMGFRPCLRCRPELTPGLGAWLGSANTVSRALYLISEGALNGASVENLAERVGVTSRHLRRLFDHHVGATPVSVAQMQRILLVKKLLDETRMSMAEIAMASGFGSIRRFNATMRKCYGRTPTELRRRAAADNRMPADGIRVKLPFTPPYDWSGMLAFLAARAIPDVEAVQAGTYCRTFAVGSARGIVEVEADPDHSQLLAKIRTSDVSVVGTIAARLRRLFDLDAEIMAIDGHLAADVLFDRRVRNRPGLRVPGAWDSFELAVRAILGQQISVAGATTLAGRLAALLGERLEAEIAGADGPVRTVFPAAASIAAANLTGIGLTRTRAATLQTLARTMANSPDLLRSYETLDVTVAKLQALPGVGPWTAQYIAMRALREPDAFPASDLGLLKAVAAGGRRLSPTELLKRAEAWRPWRAYAAVRLWLQPPADEDVRKQSRGRAIARRPGTDHYQSIE